MSKKELIQLFGEQKVRTKWDDEKQKWYFSIVDVCGVLTDQPDEEHARNYWKVLKHRLKKEGNETVTNCNQLKLLAADGKMRLTDVADMEQMFRLIESIPSKKAEPFKQWMAEVAARRVDQMQDPELNFEQAYADYRRLGYSDKWINQRLKSIEVRKELTDEWDRPKATALDAFWGQRYEDFLDIQKLLLNFAAHIKYNDYEEVSFTGNHCTHYLHDSSRAKHVQRLNRLGSDSQ